MPGRFFSQLALAHHLRKADEPTFLWSAPWVHEGGGLKRRFVIARVSKAD